MADYILKIDKNNGQVAARVASSLIQWRKFDENRQKLMKSQLERIVETQGLSKNVYEIVSKSLV
jgi:aminopeptidase N